MAADCRFVFQTMDIQTYQRSACRTWTSTSNCSTATSLNPVFQWLRTRQLWGGVVYLRAWESFDLIFQNLNPEPLPNHNPNHYYPNPNPNPNPVALAC